MSARIGAAALAIALTASPGFAQDAKLDAYKSEAARGVDEMAKLAQEMVDSVFSFGELGFQEVETSRYLTGQLEKFGFTVQRGVSGMPTAWVAEVKARPPPERSRARRDLGSAAAARSKPHASRHA